MGLNKIGVQERRESNMSEIDNLYAQISYCESQISSLKREQNEGYDFISMKTDMELAAMIKNNEC